MDTSVPAPTPAPAPAPAPVPGFSYSPIELASDAIRNSPTEIDPDQVNSRKEFDSLSITEVLDQDSHPIFVIDLDPDESITIGAKRVSPIFCNSALRLHEKLLDVIIGNGNGNSNDNSTSDGVASLTRYEAFCSWATGTTRFDDSKDVFPNTFMFFNLIWTGSTVRKRWRLISGNLWSGGVSTRDLSVICGGIPHMEQPAGKGGQELPPMHITSLSLNDASFNTATTTPVSSLVSSRQDDPPQLGATSSNTTSRSSQSNRLTLMSPECAVTDWTVPNPKGLLSPHIAFARTVHWENTPLGPMKKWSREFRQTVNLVMANPHPAALFWGSDLTMLYNEAYAEEVAGHKHPNLMGTGFSGPFSELWDAVKDIFAECARTGISIRKEDDYLPIERHGFLEETFYSWSWTPLYGGTNSILGFYNAPFETTQSVLSHRRMHMINDLGGNLSRAQCKKHFWKLLLESLAHNHLDVPFALLYSVGEMEEGDQSSTCSASGSTISQRSCLLEGSIGVPDRHVAAPQHIDLKRSCEGFFPAFREAMRTREPTLLRTKDGSLPEALLEGIDFRGFGDPCHEAVILPVRPTTGELVLGFLVLGINPRRPYDTEYQAFTSMLNRQLATSLASVLLYEDEVCRGRDMAEAAALQQEQLSQQLALQTSRLRRMAEASPFGMFLISPHGFLLEANERFFEMSGHPKGDNFTRISWLEQFEETSKPFAEEGWKQMVLEQVPWTGELQLKRRNSQLVDLDGKPIDYWVMINSLPEATAQGTSRPIMGSMTDISHLKWAQGLQNRRLQEAEENRRQQNEFIDITSHEMRNPLSAILQCTDDILSTLNNYRSGDPLPPPEDLGHCIESAHTISLCVQHQKSIVDDILTVSKLNSNLLVLTPTAAQPVDVVKRVVRMFEPESHAKNIKMLCEVDPTFQALGVDWMVLDPSRVLQILINLVTNAMKFTAGAPERRITLSVGVSRDPPLFLEDSGFQLIPRRILQATVPTGDSWGDGELLYIWFKVEDTGCGLTSEEVKVLFQRFSQASPRSHAQYGGSGLGLFISRQLAELHGGQIGVSSQAQRGSIFGFFIKTRRTGPPDDSASGDTFPIEQSLVWQATLSQTIAPQRQDIATQSPIASLIAMKEVPIDEDDKEVQLSKPESERWSTPPKFDPREIEVLVVEDNLVNQTVLVRQLRKVGLGVSVANDGVEALAFLEQTAWRRHEGGRRLSIILMDLEMPNMDGVACVREIRRMEKDGLIICCGASGGGNVSGNGPHKAVRKPHVPVVAVTANVRDEQIAAAKKSGMDDVVSKPFRIPDLLRKIESLLVAHGLASPASPPPPPPRPPPPPSLAGRRHISTI